MIALRHLHVSNFRNLADVCVDLGPLNVLVGPNGAGKSNLLSVLEFLGDSVRRDLSQAVADAGGMDRLRFRGGREAWVRIEVRAQVTSYASATAPDEYVLEFRQRRTRKGAANPFERQERFKFKRTKGQGRRITVSGTTVTVSDEGAQAEESPLDRQSLGLSTLPRLGPKQGARQVAQIADLFSTFRVFEVDVARARAPSHVSRSDTLDADAGNLAAFLAYLAEDHPDVFESLQGDVRAIVPGIEAIDFELVGGAVRGIAVVLHESGLRGPTYLSEASFGTIRALALLAMLHDPEPPKLTCAEEIDHGLHPYALDVLVDRLREASRRTQFIVATHSPTLVNRLTANELIVCERDPVTGAAIIPTIAADDVAAMEARLEGRIRLGELWFSGGLGGVPS